MVILGDYVNNDSITNSIMVLSFRPILVFENAQGEQFNMLV